MHPPAVAQLTLPGDAVHYALPGDACPGAPDGCALRRGSLLLDLGPCQDPALRATSLLLAHPLYAPASPEPAPGAQFCLPAHLLAAPLHVLDESLPGLHIGPLSLDAAGQPQIGGQPARWEDLRPLEPQEPAALAALRDGWSRLGLGPLPTPNLLSSASGYVALPAEPWPPRRLAAEDAREHLDTPERQQRRTTSHGPLRDGQPIYTRFTGADPYGSDHWGPPRFVLWLADLALQWSAACRSRPISGDNLHAGRPPPDPACALPIGDLAYYTPLRPDPLGHKDHAEGGCVDLRLLRQDGSAYEAWWNQPDDRPQGPPGMVRAPYDRTRTLDLLSLARNLGADPIFFNDPASHRDPRVRARPLSGHDDHAHLCMRD